MRLPAVPRGLVLPVLPSLGESSQSRQGGGGFWQFEMTFKAVDPRNQRWHGRQGEKTLSHEPEYARGKQIPVRHLPVLLATSRSQHLH